MTDQLEQIAPERSTKEKLLDAAQQLMLAKGYGATTVDEICETAGLTKGSFFHYFKNKEALGTAVLDTFVGANQQAVANAPFRNRPDSLERVYGYVDLIIEMAQSPMAQQGCLLGNFAQELSQTNATMQQACSRHFNEWAEVFQRDLDEAKAEYASGAAFDTRSVAEHLIAVLQGSFILAKSLQDPQIVARNLRHFKLYLENLFEK